MKVLIIGGGNASTAFMELLATDPTIHIVGLVDPDSAAPGRRLAVKMDIPTAGDIDALSGAASADVVLELTGNAKVRQMVWTKLAHAKDFMTAGSARLIYDVLSKREANQKHNIAQDLDRIVSELHDTADQSQKCLESLKSVLREMRMLSINAGVEAARTGEEGAGFAILAQRMHELVGDVQDAVDKFNHQASQSSQSLSEVQNVQAQLTDKGQASTPSGARV